MIFRNNFLTINMIIKFEISRHITFNDNTLIIKNDMGSTNIIKLFILFIWTKSVFIIFHIYELRETKKGTTFFLFRLISVGGRIKRVNFRVIVSTVFVHSNILYFWPRHIFVDIVHVVLSVRTFNTLFCYIRIIPHVA